MGYQEIFVVVALIVLFFGAKHLPALLGGLGKAPKAFKKGLKGEEDERPVRQVEEIKKDGE